MAYIQPDGIIQFFGDIGLSPNYENTLYFGTAAAKDLYFDGLTPLTTASALTYSRQQRGFVRVEKSIATMLNAGYMRFKNTAFSSKWFYAFVKSVEYINHSTTQVNFELDVMMTWMGNFQLGECFVERQHGTTDIAGDNVVEENLDLGDYVYNSVERTGLMDSYTIIIGASVDQNGDPVAGGTMINDIYSGIVLHQFGTVAAANSFIDDLTGKAASSAIVGCVMCPSIFYQEHAYAGQVVHIAKNNATINGYTPVNKKLFTYPYNYLVVTNGLGNYATMRYEFFSTSDCQFNLTGVANLQPEAVLMPLYYKNVPSTFADVPAKMEISCFPQCAFNIDQYKAFLAQNSSTIAVEAVSTATSGVINTVTNAMNLNVGGAVRSAYTAAEKAARLMAFHSDYARKPTQSNGVTTGGWLASNRKLDFYFLKQSITAQYARMIDGYFTMYGYAQNKMMTPNMNARPHWTFVKTAGCVLSGNLPADDAAKIENIFDNGIRFWKDHTKIGHYSSYSNAPT